MLRKKLQIESELEEARHNEELLILWQTTIDAEEEADALAVKEVVYFYPYYLYFVFICLVFLVMN